ncbi:PAAR domain-containing protein [Pseudomonas sp.]|uniref:PAAR domain-containing protein n=1 Tax=Pseudomonas sp. TaxID=306 RepID=UPI00263297CF|nr:PAAR domain-containing protein [Pseudomonas sp.]
MKAIIRKGDTLREGGAEVLQGRYECDGQTIACLACNVRGRTDIDEGSDLFVLDGRPGALHGYRCARGRTWASSMPAALVVS